MSATGLEVFDKTVQTTKQSLSQDIRMLFPVH